MAKETVLGFVGLGSMGSAMAPRLVEAGHRVVAFDMARAAVEAFAAAGGQGAASLEEVSREAEIVFLSLPTPQVVHDVALGGAFVGARTRVIVDLSTTGPRMSETVAKALAAQDMAFVDSPVSGGRAGALGGRLAIMAACSEAVRPEIEPLLTVFGKVFFVGETAGQAQTMKLINNLMSVVALAATSEGMALGAKAGLDAQTMIDVLNASSGVNSATKDKFPRAVLPRTFDFGFATGLSMKDVRLCLEEAERQGVPAMVGSAARTLLEITQARFGPEADFTNIARVVEEWAGVEIRGRQVA
jgi:3-hydroxyisobutyrate dehydrogenase-like beta-hydroxyacid dehydrogenase